MLRQFLTFLFTENEYLAAVYKQAPHPENMPYSDEELEALVRNEFSTDLTVLTSLSYLPHDGASSRIRIWRSEYNRGLWSPLPAFRSFRYGPEGVPINRNGNPISDSAVADAIAKFPFEDFRKVLHVNPVTEDG